MFTQILEVNPYENHPELSKTGAEVLWEYAKLNQRLKIMIVETKQLSQLPEEHLLMDLRNLETKTICVDTREIINAPLQASVWGVINEQAATADARGDADLDTQPT